MSHLRARTEGVQLSLYLKNEQIENSNERINGKKGLNDQEPCVWRDDSIKFYQVYGGQLINNCWMASICFLSSICSMLSIMLRSCFAFISCPCSVRKNGMHNVYACIVALIDACLCAHENNKRIFTKNTTTRVMTVNISRIRGSGSRQR